LLLALTLIWIKQLQNMSETINLSDIIGWFKHSGYCIASN